MILGNYLKLSQPQFSPLWKDDSNNHPPGLFREICAIMCCEWTLKSHCLQMLLFVEEITGGWKQVWCGIANGTLFMGQARALGCSNFIFKMQLTQLISFSRKFYNSNITLWSPMVNFLQRLFFCCLSDAVPVFFKPGSEEDILCDNGLPKWQLDGSWWRSAAEPGHISQVRRMCWLPFLATGPSSKLQGSNGSCGVTCCATCCNHSC